MIGEGWDAGWDVEGGIGDGIVGSVMLYTI